MTTQRRSRAREIALQALYQLDLNPEVAPNDLQRFVSGRLHGGPLVPFALSLVRGVQKRRDELDAHIDARAEHCLECLGEWPLAARLEPYVAIIVNVHVDDMLACRHDHLPLGAGDVDFAALLPLLAAGGYDGGLHVELPRQSHRWLDTARESFSFLARHLPPAAPHSPRSHR